MSFTYKDVIKKAAFRKVDVEDLLSGNGIHRVLFDLDLGYVPRDSEVQDGVDWSWCTYRYEKTGERKMINYADRPCRINTYGDSFTHSSQVSDGETWQEQLAAHFGEPIRNFGVGGQSAYLACRKALQMEETELAADSIILGIFDDDHYRNIDSTRCFRFWKREAPESPDKPRDLGGLPWAHLRYDLEKGGFVEVSSVCQTEEDLRNLCDPDVFYETFKDDHIVHLITLKLGGEAGEAQVEELEKIGAAFGLELDLRDPKKRVADAQRLDDIYGWKSNEFIIEKMMAWGKEKGKNILFLLTYMDYRAGEELAEKNLRNDQFFIDYLDKNNIPYIEVMQRHADHFLEHSIPFEEYRSRYVVRKSADGAAGHYNPPGNNFFAFAIKEELLEWLNPKPPAYR